jgi:hypothetical protein
MRHHGLDKLKVEGKPSSVATVKQVFVELYTDFSVFVRINKDAYGQRTWGVAESHRREVLTQSIIQKLQDFTVQKMAQVDSNSSFYKETIENLQNMVQHGLDIRAQRDSAQFWARNSYEALGIFLFLFPIHDFVSERTYSSSLHQGIIWLSIFTGFAAMKTLTNSVKAQKMLYILNKVLSDPKQADKMIAEGKEELSWYKRICNHFVNMHATCVGHLSNAIQKASGKNK